MIKRIKYKGVRPGRPVDSMGSIGRRITSDYNNEILEGQVQGKKASQYEERWFRAVSKIKAVDESHFKISVGAGRGQPGWKELDALHRWNGLYYAFEIDTEFTHRQKQNADVLHDAIVLNELEYIGIYPKVFHIDGEKELSGADEAMTTARNYFGS